MMAPSAAFRVHHTTTYTYSEQVSASLHQAVLMVRETPRQTVRHSHIHVEPEARHLTTRLDYFGNSVTRFGIETAGLSLEVAVESEVVVREPFRSSGDSPSLASWRSQIRRGATPADLEALEFVFESPSVPRAQDFADYTLAVFDESRGLLASVSALMHRIHEEFTYDPDVTDVSTPVETVLTQKGGVCQDFAHLMIACLRSVDMPARYVSGYLVPTPGVVGAQASHAWVSVYLPGAGWVDFDPTNAVMPAMGHITLGWGRDYSDVSPLRGVMLGGGSHAVEVEVNVEPI